MSDVQKLRAAVERATGPARARPLLELAQGLIQCYLDTGPGLDAARPILDEAARVTEEAYGYFGAGDVMRAQVCAMRGWIYGTRHVAHGSPAADRTAGIADLEEGLNSPHLPPASQAMYRVTLGQLYVAEVTNLLRSPEMTSMLVNGRIPPGAVADVEKAIACFEQLLEAPGLGREVRDVARVQLRVAQAMRTMLQAVSGASPIDRMDKLMSSVTELQRIHQEQSELVKLGPDAPGRSFYYAEQIVERDPLDRPTMLVEVDDPSASTEHPGSAPVVVPADVGTIRRRLRERVAAGGDLLEALEALLDPAAAPDTALIDETVALATAVADAGAANPTDRLLLAVGLALRGTRAGGDDLDLDDAADALTRSVTDRRVVPPDIARVTRRVAAVIDSGRRDSRATARLTEALA
jgi:hypothetical protein